jgi:hypothetical protein
MPVLKLWAIQDERDHFPSASCMYDDSCMYDNSIMNPTENHKRRERDRRDNYE